MAPPHTARPAPDISEGGPQTPDEDRLDGAISFSDSVEQLKLQCGRLVDRFGHQHSEHIFENWSPAAIKAMRIHRVDDGGQP